ncbi:MAG: carboxyl transferase domain-containing protein [Solirubrobacteraceae bacterium]|jgi:acetyl/propionyl-CoA carboxylase alpha subunit/acetyl-CoA carboxylase carboxyltransferase component
MQRPFSRLAIVNRGEAAMRVIHAVRELNGQRDEPIRLIALYTEPERDAMFVRHADEALCLDPGPIAEGDGGRRSAYLDFSALERALGAAGADAAWVGWGFVAERPEFAELCERLGIVFVGPDAAVMRLVGNKIAAKRLAEETDVPVAPWSEGPVETADDALRHGERIGFPVMIKAAAGGGGRGIRRVEAPDALPAAFASAQAEALQAFGDGTMLLERLVTGARHVEVQIIADGQGTVWAAGLRDCSCQRRNQKVIEESASPALTPEQGREVMEAARRLALRAGYQNAGTVEFLYEPAERRFSFMEVNARLQVEHPVTEAVTGLDLVKLQLHVAAGGLLEGEPPAPVGYAIEARLNAEDPALGFLPAPGRVAMLRLPTGPGVRVDTGVAEGDVIPAEFDSMIAKLIGWGHDREEALARLRRALTDTMVVLDGGTTNQGFLLELLGRPEVRTGDIDTTWLDRLNLSGEIVPVRHADLALLQAAIELAEAETEADRARFYAFARRGRPQVSAGLARTVQLRHSGQSYRFAVAQVAPGRHRVTVDGETVEVGVQRLGAHQRRLELRGGAHRTLASIQGADLLVEVDGVPHRVSRDDGGLVRNLAPGVVVSIPVAPGDEVEAGDVVAVVEAMKMENSLTAPFRGRVRQVLVGANVHVAAQAPLVALEPLDGGLPAATGERVCFAPPEPPPASVAPERCRENLRRLEWLVLGYDIEAAEVQRIIADLHDECADLLACDPALIPGEHRLLQMFADLRALSGRRHDEADPETPLLSSPQEHLHAWLRSLDTDAEGLPATFVEQLRRALAHYGVESLDRTPALEEACYRLFVSEQRAETARAAIMAVLDRRLEQAEELAGHVSDDFREALDGLVSALEGRDPVLADLAREVRFRYFDEPVIAEARERGYAEMEAHVAALAHDPVRPDRHERMAALVACPWPLAALLSARMRTAKPPLRRLLVEALARRYYRVRSLEGFEEIELDGHAFLIGRYPFEGRRRHLAVAYVELEDVAGAAAAFARHAAALSEGELAVVDLYAEHADQAPPHKELAETLRAAVADIPLSPALHRIVVGVAEPRRGRGMSAIDLFTFRPGPGGLVEDEVVRGLHPMMGWRLDLWRLSNFALERLPSPEDIYLFRGVARTNPKDERLFALAEVRDLTPIRDDDGRVVAVPELERMLVGVLETIRGFQAHRTPNRRLQWNRVLLHAWPTIELSPEEIDSFVRRLAPTAAGLGIEMLLVRGRQREPDGSARDRLLRFYPPPAGQGVVVQVDDPPTRPLQPLDEGAQRIISARRRGTLHPAEIVRLLTPGHGTPDQPAGAFVEHDLEVGGRLVPVDRPPATNPAGVVLGTIRNLTERYPEGMLRVIILGDPTLALGSLAEPECRRIIAALDLAEELGVPLEWFAISAGAKIAMDSGTENMDWIAAVLRRIVLFTQAGGELNVVVAGVNVGAQPYWNAEATMLMHTRGALIMTPESAMVLTGKQALDYSGGVSAEDNFGIGGYERIMGPNGQAQYWAPNLAGACRVLLTYYEHTYVAPGERFPRRARTTDVTERDISEDAHRALGSELLRVGDIFSDATNPGRKKPFDIRSVMRAVIDRDHPPLARWAGMHEAEIAVVWDAHLGGWPVSVIGIESRPLPRHGPIPADGPEQWTSGTLFPRASKKIARAINAAGGRRPLVVLANLAGFDGSPESMREWQLEFGAEIGRAVVNFDGPIVFCVVSRYHGGAFVVFSQKLNPNLEAVALEGAHASVIGGAPAAAVVFAREVEQAARRDERIAALDERIADAEGAERQRLRAERAALWPEVLAHKRGEFAAQFDAHHSVERAVRMGSVSGIVAPSSLRPFLVDAVERGMRRVLDKATTTDGRAGLAQPLPR